MISDHPSILLIRLSSLGDVVLVTPLIDALRERFPTSQIDFVASSEYTPLMSLTGKLSKVHSLDKRDGYRGLRKLRRILASERYDFVLDIHNVHRTRILRRGLAPETFVIDKRTFRRWLLVQFKLDQLRGEPDIIGRYFETAEPLGVHDTGVGPSLGIHSNHDDRHIALAPGARHWNKRWPEQNFTIVAKKLIEQGYHVDIHGSGTDRDISERIAADLPPESFTNYAGMLPIEETAHMIGTARAIITNDSGLMHIAEAVGTRVIAIFGPTVRQFGFMPRAVDAIIHEVKDLHCRPCTIIGLDHCPKKHFRCMTEIKPENVVKGLEIILLNTSPKT